MLATLKMYGNAVENSWFDHPSLVEIGSSGYATLKLS